MEGGSWWRTAEKAEGFSAATYLEAEFAALRAVEEETTRDVSDAETQRQSLNNVQQCFSPM